MRSSRTNPFLLISESFLLWMFFLLIMNEKGETRSGRDSRGFRGSRRKLEITGLCWGRFMQDFFLIRACRH
jgi:hypothetical protein